MCNSICIIKHLFPIYSQIHIDRITLALLPDSLCSKVLQFNCRTEKTAVAYGSYQACRFQKFGSMQSMAYETRLFKWLFSFCNVGTYSRIRFFFFFFFFEKGRNFNREKDFKQEHWFVKNLNMGDSEGPKKRKGMFLTYELILKVHWNLS